METNALDKLERLFKAARLLQGEAQEAFVAAACADDKAMQAELTSLLAADAEAEEDSFLDGAVNVEQVVHAVEALNDAQIGPYKLIEQLGAGGMGEVWLAEQKEPIKRQVAFKLIKLGMDTKEVVARFDSERQALAVMDHPNIAKVFDAGVTSTGRPYFVMELVRGVPVNEYCDNRRLSTIERIELFMDICRAVQHAHQKGVIHRDLKPSNVLISEQDDRPVPKVIDFGIAKAVGYNLTTHTLVTSIGQLVGTPAYMSPEQAERGGFDVDTRTDVYSLGVMLYELLVGTKPLDLKAKAQQAIHKAIRDSQVPRPSTRLTSLGAKKDTIAAHRQTTPDQLERELRGDLDWIVLKSIEKDRARRYDTVNGLAMELRRYLNNEPVMARPPSMAYRMQKFIRRHQTGVIAGCLIFLALIGGITAATVGLLRAQRAEALAQEEATTAERVSDFMIQLFEVSDPSVARGNSITAREILDEGAERIESELQDEPAIRARLMHTMGRVYWELGLENESTNMLEEAIRLRKETLGSDHPDVAESLRALAETKSRHFGGMAPETRQEILALLVEAKDIHTATLGPMHPEVAEDWAAIAVKTMERMVRDDSPQPDSSIQAAHNALSILEKNYGADDLRLHRMLYHIGGVYRNWKENSDSAMVYYSRTADLIARNEGSQSGLMLRPLYGLFRIELKRDINSPKVLEAFDRMWAVSDEALINTDSNPSLFITTASYLQEIGEMEKAEMALERAAYIMEKKYGPDVEDMVFAHTRLIQLYVGMERWDEVEEKVRYTQPIWERNGNRFNATSASYYAGIAQAKMGRYDEAITSLTAAAEAFAEFSPRFDLATTLWELAYIYNEMGRTADRIATEGKMRDAAFASTHIKPKRDSDDRLYALALLGCREHWKIRTLRYDCYGEPFDAETALEHAIIAQEALPLKLQNNFVLSLAHHFAGNQEQAISLVKTLISKGHRKSVTTTNLQFWLKAYERGL
ncbi:MAG: protein kinase [Bacteroidota bacterium]